MFKYGIEHVRGGIYCNNILSKDEIKHIEKIKNTVGDKCYECGMSGHFVTECKKIKLIVKPTQSGKTQALISYIQEKEKNKIVDIVFTDNSILLANQTGQRILAANCHVKIVTCKKKEKAAPDNLFKQFSKGETIVLCSNSTRYILIEQCFKDNDILETGIKFRIWIDEFDNHIESVKKYIKEWEKNNNVIGIIGLTATPSIIKNIYGNEINYIYDGIDIDKYHHVKEHIFIDIERSQKTPLEIFKYLHKKNNCFSGSKQIWFCPAESKISNHNDVKKFFLNLNFICIVINGDEKKIYYDETKTHNISKYEDKQLSVILGEWYKRFDFLDKNIVITGNLCIERGITINSEDFMITHAILTSQNTNEKLYQLGGRLNGNTKKFKNYHPPTVYCDTHNQNILLECEKIALGHNVTINEKTQDDFKKTHDDCKKKSSEKINNAIDSKDDNINLFENDIEQQVAKFRMKTLYEKLGVENYELDNDMINIFNLLYKNKNESLTLSYLEKELKLKNNIIKEKLKEIKKHIHGKEAQIKKLSNESYKLQFE